MEKICVTVVHLMGAGQSHSEPEKLWSCNYKRARVF